MERNLNYDEFGNSAENVQSNVEPDLEEFPSLSSLSFFFLSFLRGQGGLALFGILQNLVPQFAWSRYPLKLSLIAQVLNDQGLTSASS